MTHLIIGLIILIYVISILILAIHKNSQAARDHPRPKIHLPYLDYNHSHSYLNTLREKEQQIQQMQKQHQQQLQEAYQQGFHDGINQRNQLN